MEMIVFFVVAGIVLLICLALANADGHGKYSSQLIGSTGENIVQQIAASLPYPALHDVTLRTRSGYTTQIDSILVTPSGIVIIETKNMSGLILGDAKHKHWRQYMWDRSWNEFYSPLRQNQAHVKAIASILRIPQSDIDSVVAFVGSAEPTDTTACLDNVFWDRHSLREYLAAKRYGHKYGEKAMNKIVEIIDNVRLDPSADTDALHVGNVQSIKDRRGTVYH